MRIRDCRLGGNSGRITELIKYKLVSAPVQNKPDKKMEEAKKQDEQENIPPTASGGETNNQDQPEADTSKKTEGAEEQEQDEVVQLTKKEHELLIKKAQDFDKSIQLKRLAKLEKKEEKKSEEEKPAEIDFKKIEEMVEQKVGERLSQANGEKYTSNLQEAYKKFVGDNPWADDDTVIESLGKVFRPDGAIEVTDLAKKLSEAAFRAYPEKMEQAIEERAKAKFFAGEHKINAGEAGSGGGSVKNPGAGDKRISPEDKALADRFFGGNVERYLKYKK